jgi:ATP-dependent Lon protease
VSARAGEPGLATGRAWTPAGGEILFVESTRMPGKKGLTLTGSLGEVMKESAQAALSFARSRSSQLKIDPKFFDKYDIHIHVPSGAIPKDGPSAGVTMAVSLISLLTKRAVRPYLAMTGEITLRGKVMPVGGVKEKVIGAKRAGINEIIMPSQNRKDLEEVPEHVRKGLKFHFVDRMDQVIPVAFGQKPGRRA